MKRLHRQKGFTLVELAIVLTIIGLLIGGILKGQQLITNARVTAQMAQIQGIEAAVTTFNDTYAGLPGDLVNAATRVPNCTLALCPNGNGNGIVGAAVATVVAAEPQGLLPENLAFWQEMSLGGLIGGVSGNVVAFGNALPSSKIPGGLIVAQMTTAPYTGLTVSILGTLAVPNLAVGGGAMTPGQAAQIDRKMDDGQSQTGSVIGYGLAANCTTAANTGYLENVTTNDCGLSWRVNQ
jgi:prepilin-type N-terminal cleavage/methylation domain-containing protein